MRSACSGANADDVEHHTHEPALFPWTHGTIGAVRRGRRAQGPSTPHSARLRGATDADPPARCATRLFPVARVCAATAPDAKLPRPAPSNPARRTRERGLDPSPDDADTMRSCTGRATRGLPGGQRHAGPRRRRTDGTRQYGAEHRRPQARRVDGCPRRRGHDDRPRRRRDPARQRSRALGARRHLRPRGLPARVVLRWHRRRDPRAARDAERQALQAGRARHRRPAAFAGRDPARRARADRRLRGPRVELRARRARRRKGRGSHPHRRRGGIRRRRTRIPTRRRPTQRARRTRTPTLPRSHPRPTTRRSRSTSPASPASRPNSRRAPRTSSRSR